jgi:alanyl-tRNA synthetase
MSRKNIDTGAGLERFACVCQDVATNFDTDTFQIIIHSIESCCKFKYGENEKNDKNFRIIADHMKANVFAIADGAIPTPKDRGSVLRKLIRRTMVCCKNLQCSDNVLNIVVEGVIEAMNGFYPYLVENKSNILAVVEKERKIFNQTLSKGYKLFNEVILVNKEISGKVAFDLVQTYGFPFEVIKELARENGGSVNEKEFEVEFQHHREISRANQVKSG